MAACLFPSTSLGREVRAVTLSFGAPGSGDGQLELAESSGLAVNETSHDVYAADTGNHRIVQFDESGDFVRAFGADVGGAGVDVCTSGCAAGTATSAPGGFEAPVFVAVDNSGGPSDGDVYVADSGTHLVTKFEADGTLIIAWGSAGQLDGSTATDGPFGPIAGIAVDATGDLEVYQALLEQEGGNFLFRFEEDGGFVGDFATARGTLPRGLAVGPGARFYKVNGDQTVERFEGAGDVGQVSLTGSTTGLAVDPSSGSLFVDNGTSIDEYAFGLSGEVLGSACLPAPFEGCAPTTSFAQGELTAGAGLAVDGAADVVYAADAGAGEILAFGKVILPDATTGPADSVAATAATLHGTVSADGGPGATCLFEYVDETGFEESGFDGAATAPCVPGGPFTGSGAEAVSADLSSLDIATVYRFRLVASNANGTTQGADEQFETLGPSVSAATASQITATEARISGQINPNGEPTSFRVEYVTEEQFQLSGFEDAESTPESELGSGTEFKEVIRQLTGLVPNTAYRFRIVAKGGTIENAGPAGRLTTFASIDGTLPDGRAYELVSPPQKSGEVFPPEPNMALGGRFTSTCPIECLPGVNLPQMPMQASAGGAAIVYQGQPFSGGFASGPNEYLSTRGPGGWATRSLTPALFRTREGGYKSFSDDLSLGIVHQVAPALSPAAPSVGGKSFANLYLVSSEDGTVEPLIAAEPPHRDPGFFDPGINQNAFRLLYSGANAGTALAPPSTHVVFEANDALTAAVPGIAPAAPEVAVGEDCSFAGANCNLYEWFEGELRLVNVLPDNEEAAAGAVVGSGRQLLTSFPAQGEGPDVDHAISDDGSRIFWSGASGQVYVRVDGERTLKVQDPGRFVTASADGSRVLLSDGCLYDVEGEACKDLTADETELPRGGFQGILGATQDLATVYFVDTAVLTGEAENGNGERAEDGAFNLYVRRSGETTFVARLIEADNRYGDYGDWRFPPSNRLAQMSADGRYLAFMSKASLTRFDNQVRGAQCKGNGAGGTSCYEVFEYDAALEELSCASCSPTGQRPLGQSNLSLIRPSPGYPLGPQLENLPGDGEGVVFFESQDELSPRDTNGGIQDVYEWKPTGVRGCERARGCVTLISSGHGSGDSMFLDTTPSADDVFFITRDQLVPEDRDEQLDVYDARVGGGFGPVAGSCSGKGCGRSLSSPPPPLRRASLDFRTASAPKTKPRCKHGARKRHRCAKKNHGKRHRPGRSRGGSR